jgi:hypothetical protein
MKAKIAFVLLVTLGGCVMAKENESIAKDNEPAIIIDKESIKNKLDQLQKTNLSDFSLEEVQKLSRDGWALSMLLDKDSQNFFILGYHEFCVKSPLSYSQEYLTIDEKLFLGESNGAGFRKTGKIGMPASLVSGQKFISTPAGVQKLSPSKTDKRSFTTNQKTASFTMNTTMESLANW